MTVDPLPLIRNGRKFYITTEDVENFSAEQQRFSSRSSAFRNHRSSSNSGRPSSKISPVPQQRTASNAPDSRFNSHRTPQTTFYNEPKALIRQEARPSRSILKNSETYKTQSLIDSIESNKTPSVNRSRSREKVLEYSSTSLTTFAGQSELNPTQNETQRPVTAEIVQLTPLNTEQKQRAKVHRATPRPPNEINSNHGHSNHTSRLNDFFMENKTSWVTSSNRSSSITSPSESSALESNVTSSELNYSGSTFSYRTGNEINSTTFVRSKSNETNLDFHSRNSLSSSNFESGSSLVNSFVNERNQNMNPDRPRYFINEPHQHKNPRQISCNETRGHAVLNDLSNTKKRVRFADTEGFNLEILPSKKQSQRIDATIRRLTKKKSFDTTSPINSSIKPAFTTIFQAVTGINSSHNRRNKLVTYV